MSNIIEFPSRNLLFIEIEGLSFSMTSNNVELQMSLDKWIYNEEVFYSQELEETYESFLSKTKIKDCYTIFFFWLNESITRRLACPFSEEIKKETLEIYGEMQDRPNEPVEIMWAKLRLKQCEGLERRDIKRFLSMEFIVTKK